MNHPRITYSIGDTSRMTGVSQKQIRNWEAKGYIHQAYRVVCGERAYRRFTPEEVSIISAIKGFMDKGFTLQASAEKAVKNAASKEGNGHA
ncbi:MAG: MerR family transcriptional regulator [Pseudomonadota bacterium]